MFFFHYKLNLQQKLHFFYRSQAADALRSESASGRSQRTGAYWMESKQNVFFLNWTHFDTFWVILTCFHDDFFHFFWAVLWVCSNVQGFIAFAFVSTCSFFLQKGECWVFTKSLQLFQQWNQPTTAHLRLRCSMRPLGLKLWKLKLSATHWQTPDCTHTGRGSILGFRGLERWAWKNDRFLKFNWTVWPQLAFWDP